MSSEDYPSDWNSRRRNVYKRDNYKCQNCGRKGGSENTIDLHAHHIVPKAKGGSHKKSNLVTICEECHKAIHGDMDAPSKKLSETNNWKKEGFPAKIKDTIDLTVVYDATANSSHVLGNIAENIVSDKYTHYTFFKEYKNMHDKIKNARTILIKAKLLVKNMSPSFDKLFEDSTEPREFIYLVAKKEHVMLKSVGVSLETANKIEEYLSLVAYVFCPNCGEKEEINSSFCGGCGEELPNAWQCSDCGEQVKKLKQNYCNSCGSEVNALPSHQFNKIETARNELEGDPDRIMSIWEIGAENDEKLSNYIDQL